MSSHGLDEHQNKNLPKAQTFGNAEEIPLTSFSSIFRNVALLHCDSVCKLGPQRNIAIPPGMPLSLHSNLIKTEAHAQGYLRARPSGISRQVRISRAGAEALPTAQSACCPRWAREVGFSPRHRIQAAKDQACKIPTLHAPYQWKLEAMMEDRQTRLNISHIYELYVLLQVTELGASSEKYS